MKPALGILLILASILLSGCAASDFLLASQGLPTAAGRRYLYGQQTLDAAPPAHSPLAPAPDSALVLGWGATLGEGLTSTVSYKRGAWVSALYIQKDNGQNMAAKNVVHLAPGRHHLELFCDLHIGGMWWHGAVPLDVDVMPAHVYELHAHNESTTCVPTLQDVTNETASR